MAFCNENEGCVWGLLRFVAARTRYFCAYQVAPALDDRFSNTKEVRDGALTVASVPGGLGNAGDIATTTKDLISSINGVNELSVFPTLSINTLGVGLRWGNLICNAALIVPSAFTSYLIGYANSLEFKKFLSDCLSAPLTFFRMFEFIPRIIMASGNFFYNALLNNWSALSKFLVYALMSLGFGPMSWPVLLAMIIPQVIGTMTNMPVYDAFKDTLSELKNALLEMKKIFVGLYTGETSCEDLAWFGVKLIGVLLAVGIALFTDFPNYFFAAYQGFARYGSNVPKLWLKIVSLLFAFVGGVDAFIVAKIIYRTAEKMIKDLYKGQCHSTKKSMLILGCSLIGMILVWRMGVIDPGEIEKITQRTLGLLLKDTKSIEDALKFIAKFISPFCQGISGFFLTKDKIDRKEVFEMLNNLKHKLSSCFEKRNGNSKLCNCWGSFYKKRNKNVSVTVTKNEKHHYIFL
jgi:hypothetical protein